MNMNKKMVIVGIIFIVVLACIIISKRKESLSFKITRYMNNNYTGNKIEIELKEFTNFEWDKVLIYEYPTSAQEIVEALGIDKYEGNLDLMSGVIFVKEDKIVYEEIFKQDYVSTPRFYIYASKKTSLYENNRVFTYENSQFEGLKKDDTGYAYYHLRPSH